MTQHKYHGRVVTEREYNVLMGIEPADPFDFPDVPDEQKALSLEDRLLAENMKAATRAYRRKHPWYRP